MGRSSRTSRPVRAAIASAFLAALCGCADLATVADVVFPVTVPGLPADEPWTSLPVRRWMTESSIEPVAISACIPPGCAEPAAAGLYRARGAEATALSRAAGTPALMLAALAPRPVRGAAAPQRPLPTARVSAVGAAEGGRPGVLVRLARPGGGRAAFGYVAAVETDAAGGATRVLVVVAASEARARALAAAIVPRL